MPRTVFVISDLHLGGRPGFQICSPAGRALLADFLDWIAHGAGGGTDLHLVVNGDLVDFLAEEPYEVFTADDTVAARKLDSILTSTKEVWDAFQKVSAAGVEITVLLGNHDLELALPGPTRLLRGAFGPGRVAFLFDNQALDLGDVLIEHGNRYDAWNVVDHDRLRQIRSAVSRRERPVDFPAPAGSRLVIDVMNGVKEQLRFVDLLKPENDAVLPLLAALTPVSAGQIRMVMRYFRMKRSVRYGPGQAPLDEGNIADTTDIATAPPSRGEQLADEILLDLVGHDTAAIGFTETLDFFHLWRNATPARHGELLGRLYDALRHRIGAHYEALKVDRDLPEYVEPATASTDRGFKVILYGHTHLAKRVPLSKGDLYLNTGTWADLMMLPRALLRENKLEALADLDDYVADLANNRLDRWRRPVPTFARLEMDGARVLSAGVHVYTGGGRSEPLPPEMLELGPVSSGRAVDA